MVQKRGPQPLSLPSFCLQPPLAPAPPRQHAGFSGGRLSSRSWKGASACKLSTLPRFGSPGATVEEVESLQGRSRAGRWCVHVMLGMEADGAGSWLGRLVSPQSTASQPVEASVPPSWGLPCLSVGHGVRMREDRATRPAGS